MSLRSKLWCSFGGLLLILIAVSVLSVAVLTRYSRALENVFRENYQSAVYCNGMKEALDRLNARAEHLVWRENDAAALIDADAERRQFETDLSRQLGNISLPGETQLSDASPSFGRSTRPTTPTSTRPMIPARTSIATICCRATRN